MSTVRVNHPHGLGVEGAKRALAPFEADLSRYGLKLAWRGNVAEVKGAAASGDVRVTDSEVAIEVKLGMMAKMAGIDAARLTQSIEKRLKAALEGGAVG